MLDPELKQYLEQMETRIDDRIDRAEVRILERTQEKVRDAQTELLRGFESFSRTFGSGTMLGRTNGNPQQ